jgi:hypothetical protein
MFLRAGIMLCIILLFYIIADRLIHERLSSSKQLQHFHSFTIATELKDETVGTL